MAAVDPKWLTVVLYYQKFKQRLKEVLKHSWKINLIANGTIKENPACKNEERWARTPGLAYLYGWVWSISIWQHPSLPQRDTARPTKCVRRGKETSWQHPWEAQGFFFKNYLWVLQYQNYNWLNLASTPVTTLAWSSCNIAEVRKIRLAASMNLVHHGPLFQRRVTKECLTMFNIDESLWKTA